MAQTQSSYYGYYFQSYGSGAYSKSVDDMQDYLRQVDNQPTAGLSFGYPQYAATFKWTMQWRPFGSIQEGNRFPPEEYSSSYHKLIAPTGTQWPPSTLDPSCASFNGQCVQYPYGWCPDRSIELARVTCQINATYPPNGLCLQSPPTIGGSNPVPFEPTGYALPGLPDPTGQGRQGLDFDYIVSDLAQTEYIEADIAPCTEAPDKTGSPSTPAVTLSPPLPGGGSPYRWPLAPRYYYWCSAATLNHYDYPYPNVCAEGYKRQVWPVTFKQTPPATCHGEGDPCGPGNGNESVDETDFSTASISFHRYYNSLRELKPHGYLDQNWSHSFSQRIQTRADSDAASYVNEWIAIQNERGLADLFIYVTGLTPEALRASTRRDVVLYGLPTTSIDATQWVEVFPDGHLLKYDRAGRLRQIEYPDDERRTLNLTYLDDTPPPAPPATLQMKDWHYFAVDTVSDSLGRGIQFDYAPPNDPVDLQSWFVQVVGIHAYPSGETLASYAYDDERRLASVTMASATRQYRYDEPGQVGAPNQLYNLTSIIDENNATYASYWYDDYGRATRSAHAGGAEEVQLAYDSDTSVSVTRASGEVVNYNFDLADIWRRPASITDGNGFTSSTILNNSPACPAALGNPSDERVCQETDRRGNVKQYQYGASGNASLFTKAMTEAIGTPQQRRIEWDRYDQSLNYRLKERRVFNASNTLEAKTQWVYNARSQIAARCEIDPGDAAAMGYACSATTAPPAGAKVRRWTYTYCEDADVTAGSCPIVGFLTERNGPRPANDTGMVGYDDTTSYSYYMDTDESGCGTAAGPCHRTGDLWRVTNALGQITEFTTYDAEGRVARKQDVNGTYTDFTYHPRGWLLTRTVRANANGTPSSGDATTTIDYDDVGNVIRVTQPDGAYIHYTYDDAHRLTDLNDNLDDRIHYTLDASGNRTQEETYDPSNTLKRELSRSYDTMNRLHQTLNAASQATMTYPTGTGYDEEGNPTLSTDGLGTSTHQDYDALNRLVKTLQNYNGTDLATRNTETDYTYDTRDNLLTVQDPDHLTTTYTYDGLDNLTALASPDTGNTSYTPDLAGNRVAQTDARGKTSTYTYDALNRLTGMSYPTSGLNVTDAYDQSNAVTGCPTSYPIGRLTQMTDASGTTSYCYDRRGNLLRKIQSFKSATLTTRYSYTLADRLASITYPGGSITTYVRDSVGRVTAVQWAASAVQYPPSTVVSDATYYPFGPLNTLTFANGRTLSKTYDQDYAIDTITSSAAGGLTLDLSVDVMGDITAASGTINPAVPDHIYLYDPLYRLTNVQTGTASALETYTYNQTGDRLSATIGRGATIPYTYTAGTHRLDSVGGVARSNDANGNTTSANGITFVYDDTNRLSQAGSGVYTYNGRGERMIKKTTSGTSLFVYDEGGKLLGEYTTTGSAIQTYLWLDDTLVGIRQGTTTYYVETDHLGTPRQVIDPGTNTAVWTWDLLGNAFGTYAPTASSFTLNLRFPGQYFDMETGLNYNYFRNYESFVGRYVEGDPANMLGGISLYAYVENAPLIFADKLGLGKWTPRPPNPRPRPIKWPKPEKPDPSDISPPPSSPEPGGGLCSLANLVMPLCSPKLVCVLWDCNFEPWPPPFCPIRPPPPDPFMHGPDWDPAEEKACTCTKWAWQDW